MNFLWLLSRIIPWNCNWNWTHKISLSYSLTLLSVLTLWAWCSKTDIDVNITNNQTIIVNNPDSVVAEENLDEVLGNYEKIGQILLESQQHWSKFSRLDVYGRKFLSVFNTINGRLEDQTQEKKKEMVQQLRTCLPLFMKELITVTSQKYALDWFISHAFSILWKGWISKSAHDKVQDFSEGNLSDFEDFMFDHNDFLSCYFCVVWDEFLVSYSSDLSVYKKYNAYILCMNHFKQIALSLSNLTELQGKLEKNFDITFQFNSDGNLMGYYFNSDPKTVYGIL